MRLSLGSRASASSKPSCDEAIRGRGHDDRIAELVEIAEEHAAAVGKELLVERDGVGLVADEIDRELGGAAAGEPGGRSLARAAASGSSSSIRAAVRCVSDSFIPATTSGPTERPSACNGPGVGKYSAATTSNGHSVMSDVRR